MTQHEDYVSPEQAVKLKAAGFDWGYVYFYTKEDAPDSEVWLSTLNEIVDHNHLVGSIQFSAPTLAQAQKWLISKGVFVEISCFGKNKLNPDDISGRSIVEWWSYELVNTTSGDYIGEHLYVFDDYTPCLSAGITAALNLITNEHKGQ